jgi:hypothetical protein
MSSFLTLSKEYEIESTVARNAYSWYFPDPVPQIDRAPEFNDVFAAVTQLQIEMFPRQTSVEAFFEFKYLMESWREERGSTSSTREMVMCPSYQAIIGMGPNVVRFILAELASEGADPDHWFWALQVLTRANPVSEEDEGNLSRMSRAWLEWGASQGYAW